MLLSRRYLARLLAGAVYGQRSQLSQAAAIQPFHVDRLLGEHPSEPVTDQYRQYRADAVVSLLSIPIFSRAGVGSGYASYRRGKKNGATVTMARFGGGSFPARAHNLNRFGVIEEVVVENESGPVEAAYFGFMTSSPEEGIGDARKSLEASGETVPYVAIEGLISAAKFRSVKQRFQFPGKLTWSERASIIRQVRLQFYASTPEIIDLPFSGGSWPGTFLACMVKAIQQHAGRFQGEYVYNAKHFRINLEKSADAKMAAVFAAKRLTARPQAVSQFHGLIHDDRTGKVTRFRLWIEEDGASLLPLRIELQARSFLALAFEYDPALPAVKEA